MTIGEKIQQLRKERNLSQEQLAGQLAVSRQAISKWELGESIPETDKIILLSKRFEVSTDYLLHDDINSDNDIPAVKTNTDFLTNQYQLKTQFIVSTGINIVGLLMSVVAQLTWQTVLSVSVGLLFQIIGIFIFEAMSSQYSSDSRRMVRKNFYALSAWLVLPFPVLFLTEVVFRLYPRPRGYGIDLLIAITLYLLICGTITFLLKKKQAKIGNS